MRGRPFPGHAAVDDPPSQCVKRIAAALFVRRRIPPSAWPPIPASYSTGRKGWTRQEMRFGELVTLLAASVATGVHRQLPRRDLHPQEHSAFHGALNNPG